MSEFHNLSVTQLMTQSIMRQEGILSKDGALVVNTGKFKGRAANDKFIVLDNYTAETVDWSANKAFGPENFNYLWGKVEAYLQGVDKFTQKLYAGPARQLRFEMITTSAWHSLFAKTMFYTDDLSANPAWTLYHVPNFYASPSVDKTNSSAFIILNFTEKVILIGGTAYAGEIKKSVFTALNFLLPEQGILPMHASVNETNSGKSTVFFGLSGTGKTTLSADSKHILIGDDEHGWDDNDGVFNFEDGCYAKAINLSPATEPEIWGAVNKFGSVLENVCFSNLELGELDFTNSSLTENTRGAYKLNNIPNASKTRRARHPNNIIMLTCDASGVLPPVASLSPTQAVYQFLSGYTAKVAGTEVGITEPVSTFSACFGAPFLPRRPLEYGTQLYNKIIEHDVNVWLVNTGWTGGPYGTGSRIKLDQTRAIVNAIIDTPMDCDYWVDLNFGFKVPNSVPGVNKKLLNPKSTWKTKTEYDFVAQGLVERFKNNFNNKYKITSDSIFWNAGPM